MAEITVDLREGFFREVVVIKAKDRELARLVDVTTRMQVGLAASLDLDDTAGIAALTIAIPARGVEGEVKIPPVRPLWVGVSFHEPRRFEFRVQEEPFGYV